jgi:hypothetical protein
MILQRVKNLLWYPPSERKERPLGSYSRTFPWKTLYYRVSVCSVPPLLLGVTGALIVRGPSGLAGFMLGFLIIYICFTLGVLTVLGATRLRVGIPQALVCAYVVKASLMGVVLLTVPIPENIKHGWTLAGAIIGAVLWLSIEAITINNIRILYFDSEP